MSRDERIKIIKEIEKKRNSRLIVYITGDRLGLETKISADIFPKLHKHLISIGNQKKIDLFLYSTGGITIAGFSLVNLIREFCERFCVIIPFKALSCATLIALGADEIIMSKMGQLGPIDPSLEHPLGPSIQIPGRGHALTRVNVEDVNAFIELAKEEFKLKSERSLVKSFELLASSINPLVLGAVQRSRAQIAFLASSLLKSHINDKKRINKIVNTLIRKRFSHDYIINRKEAKEELLLNIIDTDEELMSLILTLFNLYNNIIKMDTPFHPEVSLGTASQKTEAFNQAIIESNELTHIYRTTKEIKRVLMEQPGVPFKAPAYQEIILQQGWVEDLQI